MNVQSKRFFSITILSILLLFMQISPLAFYKLKLFLKFLLLLMRAQWNYFYPLTPIKCFNNDPPYWASTSNVLVSMANLFKLKVLWYLPLSRGCWPLLNRYIRSFPPSLLAFAMHPGWDFLPTNCSSLNCNQNNSYSLIGKYGEIPALPKRMFLYTTYPPVWKILSKALILKLVYPITKQGTCS